MTRTLLPSAVLAVSLAAGCAQGIADRDGADVHFDADSPVAGALNVMGFAAQDEIGQTRLDAAGEAMPDVDVSLVEGELDVQQFMSAVSTGEPPDLIYANRDQIGTFASRGAIMPLDDCLDGEGIDIGLFREPAVAQVSFGDSVYGVPEFNQVQITMANADLLAEAGLDVADVNGSDWEAVTAANRELHHTEDDGLSVIGFDSKLPEFLPLWAKANGADLLSADGRTAHLDDPAVIEALEFAVAIYEEQGGFGAVKALRDSADFFGSGNQFASGSLGAMPFEQWYVNILNDVSPDAPLAFDTFRDRRGEPLAFASGSAWAIPEGSANPQAACRFLKTMTATDTWLAAAQARADARAEEGKPFTGLLTCNVEADAQIRDRFVDETTDSVWAEAVTATYTANAHTFSLPANPADAEFEAAWQDAVNRVLNGEAAPAEALREAQTVAQEALDTAWAQWAQR
ncbi:multiple sugar transport system substrate-binding protein [Stackebrandtia albiflava]|uniref:Multiple sugar transport system substrate-binding protein n=1 Tax=Stackebrandtia albiflava TaxID=406432 RepID=A0A562VA45_9ACTN|nr:extracellular solute-binding protein [Stackebrandtia albiflava]TWJ14711.1 multiple sugar transport system substrate-binding protein [Stackebrandtia albiflava]